MHVVMSSSAFKDAIMAAHAIIPTKAQEATAKILIEASADGSIWVSGRTEEMTIRTRIQAIKVKKPGTLVLAAARIERVAQVITADQVQLTASGLSGVLKAGKANFKLPGASADDLLAEPTIEYANSWTIPAKTLKFMTDHTAFATDTPQGGRPVLEGMLLEQTSTETRLVATDGKQLAKAWIVREGTGEEEGRFLLPSKALQALSKHFDLEAEVQIGHHLGRVLGFKQENVSLTVRLIQGNYPLYEKVIPKETGEEKTALVSRSSLIEALRHMAAVAPAGNHRVSVAFDLVTTLAVKASEGGSADMELPVKYEGEPVTVDFDVDYFLGVVGAVAGDKIRLRLTTASRAVVVEPESVQQGVHMLALVMPLRPESEDEVK